jgi:DNA-binding NarL/FixJ family response regulator
VTTPKRTTVVLVDDHPVFRHGLAALLAEDGIDVVAQAGTAADAISAVATHRPDVVVMDLHLPDLSGVQATRKILAAQPDVRILVLTMDSADAAALAALRAGARGYLLKEAAAESIGGAIAALVRGELVLDAHVADRLPSLLARREATNRPADGAAPNSLDIDGLSSRELEILTLVAQGLGNAEIGGRLYLAEKTVRNNVTSILAKTESATRAALIARARDLGL